MGKKARKTRWRTLEITDELSDSEESQTTTTSRLPKSYQQKSYYNKLPYSSQSTPRRKFQHDGIKSTRSSSTASENKITFNEDEYTRITTPRQDVLFKKGYLNKPKNYQTQTSTGTSTTSTGNSTGNGTPDHQSTDLEYDSQFVFPNGFVDHNGIYYLNSFEPYPLMLYNPPTYYTELTDSKSKRYSTGSLTESTSPNNEEATSQDLSGGEASNNVSEYSGHHSGYNMVYPGYYIDEVCPPQEIEVEQHSLDESRKIKKRRRRKSTKSQTNNQEDSTECSEDEEVEPESRVTSNESIEVTSSVVSTANPLTKELTNNNLNENNTSELKTTELLPEAPADCKQDINNAEPPKLQKYHLKPDAEEFVPRAYRSPDIPVSPVQFIKVPPSFVPIPVLPFNGQINPAFIPPGSIPINFLPPDPKMFPPNFYNIVPNHSSAKIEENRVNTVNDQNLKVCDNNTSTAKIDIPTNLEKPTEKVVATHKTIDIATVVSKLEEAVKEQEENKEESTKLSSLDSSPKRRQFRTNAKFRNHYRANFYTSPRHSPKIQNGENTNFNGTNINESRHINNSLQSENQTETQYIRNSPEKYKKNWKSFPHQNGNSRSQRSPKHMQKPNMYTIPKDYSETLKTSNVLQTKLESEQTAPTPASPQVSLPLKLPNQWIAVSNKKKRKNKGTDEQDENDIPIDIEDNQEEDNKDDQFESYDVSMLVDVIPPRSNQEETLKVDAVDEKVENVINSIAKTESDVIEENQLSSTISSVTEIENELVNRNISLEEKEEMQESVSNELNGVSEVLEIVENNSKETKISKKKSKKSSQKAITKRVIITDIDMSDKQEEIKPQIKKIVKKVDKTKDMPEVKVNGIQELNNTEELLTAKPEVSNTVEVEEEKKKNKKKKKKTTKIDGSLSSSTTTLNITDDGYDVLLDVNLAVNADKTNDEISVELDKIIFKGMYNNLEEKMKSLNISESDGFFKLMFSKVPVTGRPEAAGYLKSPDFTKIPLLQSDSVSEDQSLETKITNDELPASESSEVILGSNNFEATQAYEEINDEPKSLYPITEAVKEWMCRTRETTPDVEIFKSPTTIYKEFYASETTSDIELYDTRNDISASVDEDEITIFTTEDVDNIADENSDDLLEYWENLKTDDETVTTVAEHKEDVDEVEVYESKYGKNEDYLRLQKEVRDKMKKGSYKKHEDFPHRAVCCNVM